MHIRVIIASARVFFCGLCVPCVRTRSPAPQPFNPSTLQDPDAEGPIFDQGYGPAAGPAGTARPRSPPYPSTEPNPSTLQWEEGGGEDWLHACDLDAVDEENTEPEEFTEFMSKFPDTFSRPQIKANDDVQIATATAPCGGGVSFETCS